MKSIFKTALVLLLCLTVYLCTVPAAYAEGVAINETNFPDEVFRKYVSQVDKNGDGILSKEEIADVREFFFGSNGLKSLKGIEFFTELKALYCYDTQLDELDLRNNTALTELDCSDNRLTKLDVSNNKALASLYCSGNQLSSLDISRNTALTSLNCSSNQLTSLDVSNNTALKTLYCSNNSMISLDVSRNTALTRLDCSNDFLKSLNVTNNSALTNLSCSNNQLSSLNVSNNTLLTSLSCYDNRLTSLDLSNNTALKSLSCYNNSLTGLDVSDNTALTSLYCYNNQLTSLYTHSNTALTSLNCGNNQLTSLNVIDNTALTSLNCYGNNLTDLDLSHNTLLINLYCQGNQLNSLDLSNNVALTVLNCNNNQLEKLDLNHNTALTSLWCDSNSLTSLDVENCIKLKNLYCTYNNITSLDISCCPILVQLVNNYQPIEDYAGIRYGGRNNGYNINELLLYYGKDVTLITDPEAVVTVTFDKNAPDAEGEMKPQPLNNSETAKLTTCTYVRSEYIFNGWNTEADGSGTYYADGDSITISGSITLYAQWIEGYTIRFDKNSADATRTMEPLFVTKGKKAILTSNSFSRSGYGFTGWNTDPDGSGVSYENNASFVPVSDMTLYAQWARRYIIRYYLNNGTSSYFSSSVTEGASITVRELSYFGYNAPAGKEFAGWNTKADGSGISYEAGVTFKPTEDMNLYVQWKKEEAPYEVVAIDEKSFPDVVFRLFVRDNFDTDGNGSLNNREIASVTSMKVGNKEIISLKGIEFFTNLASLNCNDNYLKSLDLSKNTALTSLNCSWNQLTSLDVSNCRKLRTLSCSQNQLTSLDLTVCSALESLTCDRNKLTSLSLDSSADLGSLSCYGNQISSLDVSSCPALSTLNCSNNQLTSLNISGNPNLKSLSCGNNKLTSLDFSCNTALTTLTCSNNTLTSLDLSTNKRLESLVCGNDQLSSLILGNNPNIRSLNCSDNQLETLEISTCPSISYLNCSGNRLKTLSVGNCSGLSDLKCNNNALSDLDIGKNSLLLGLSCQGNQLRELDIRACSGLTMLVEAFDPEHYNGIVYYGESYKQRYLSYDENVVLITNDAVPAPDFILPASLTTIEAEAFAGGAFNYAQLSEGVTAIGSRAFADCPNLAYIYIPTATGTIAKDAFADVDGLTILGHSDSYAEFYAQRNGYTFVALD